MKWLGWLLGKKREARAKRDAAYVQTARRPMLKLVEPTFAEDVARYEAGLKSAAERAAVAAEQARRQKEVEESERQKRLGVASAVVSSFAREIVSEFRTIPGNPDLEFSLLIYDDKKKYGIACFDGGVYAANFAAQFEMENGKVIAYNMRDGESYFSVKMQTCDFEMDYMGRTSRTIYSIVSINSRRDALMYIYKSLKSI